MRTFIYIAWALLPLFFFFTALWTKLEAISHKRKRSDLGDLIRQGFFVLACVLVCVLIDQFILESLHANLAPDWIPLGFLQIILLPIVLLVASKCTGGSKTILITKAPHPSDRRKR